MTHTLKCDIYEEYGNGSQSKVKKVTQDMENMYGRRRGRCNLSMKMKVHIVTNIKVEGYNHLANQSS